MSGTSPGSDPVSGPPVDRRWFEEALRAQGFVVEPPVMDDEPGDASQPSDVAQAGAADPSAATRDPDPSTVDGTGGPATIERPPVPSALLARIAVRGPAPTTRVEPSPAAAPWTDAVVATIAPWSSPDGLETVTPDEPSGSETPPAEPEPSAPAALEQATEPSAPEPTVVEPALETPLVLESPYIGPQAGLEASTPSTAAPAAATGSGVPEGELWALVGGSEQSAAQASGSGALRVTLTILVALVILAVVVGALVLASQLT